MPIISTIGRRSLKTRALIAVIYAGLSVGALTMLYPFGLMIAGSTKSAVDSPDARLIPAYLQDDAALWQKYTEALYNESLEMLQVTMREKTPSFAHATIPVDPHPALTEAWREWIESADLPFYSYSVGQMYAPQSRGVLPRNLRAFKNRMLDATDGDIQRLNDEYGARFPSWYAFAYRAPEYLLRRNKPTMRPLDQDYRAFQAALPVGERYYFSAEGYYVYAYLIPRYARSLDTLNRAWGTAYADWTEVRLPQRLADIPPEPAANPAEADTARRDWLIFTREIVNLYWLRADAAAALPYRDYLRAKYQRIAVLNDLYGTAYADFDAVPLVAEAPPSGTVVTDWEAFIQGWNDPTDAGRLHQLADADLRIHSIDDLFRDHLRERFGDVDAMNQALGTQAAAFIDIVPPQKHLQYAHFRSQTGALRQEFTTRNFVTVADFMILRGRGVVNTVIYCLLAIASALIVNPLAAYALSRYKPPSQYKVLLFLMLTMAFPPMVTMIPTFLMLREFHLLNTFWALILPGLANGYSIFLLKGFFDSLPRDLYEAAEIDGASELRIFMQITMSLSKPILAVIALNAFVSAYSNFMMALLICQDQDMWTIMPWLYQLQQQSGEGVVFASLLIAALPTFVVFSLCQNIIMRGIVVPVEK